MKQEPVSIENRWDILYRDFPEIYDEFAAVSKTPDPLNELIKLFPMHDKIVIDVGSGSGLSTFTLAQTAQKVIGIEIEDSMRNLALHEVSRRGIVNVDFVKGDAKHIPLLANMADVVIGVTLAIYPIDGYRDFIKEATRIVKTNGLILMLNIAPGWYGGELSSIIQDYNTGDTRLDDMLVNEFGFSWKDIDTIQEYGSLEKIISTYGFIFGQKAIDYLSKNQQTTIKWKFRIHYKTFHL